MDSRGGLDVLMNRDSTSLDVAEYIPAAKFFEAGIGDASDETRAIEQEMAFTRASVTS